MDREKLIQEVIKSRINSNGQIKEANGFISEYNEKQEILNMESSGINLIMDELQSLSESIEQQTEEEKMAEFKAYEKALEKVEKEKEKYEEKKISLKNELDVYKNTLKEKANELKKKVNDCKPSKFSDCKDYEKEFKRLLKQRLDFEAKSRDMKIAKEIKINGLISEARSHYEMVCCAAEYSKPLLVKYDDNLKKLEKAKETIAQLEQEIQENKPTYDDKVANVKALKAEIENNVRKELEVYTNTFVLYCVCKNNFLAPIMKLIYNRK